MSAQRAPASVDDSLALSVWPVAQKTARVQRRGRYLPASTAHPGKMLPELARTIIRAYSQPGELVLDPMCGIGTTLVEAIHLGRDAIGVELEPRWATLAAANLALAREQGAPAHALALHGDARRLGHGLLDELARRGRADPHLAAVRPIAARPGAQAGHGRGREVRRPLLAQPRQPRPPPRTAGRQRRPSFDAALAEILAGCARMLAPDGRLVLTVRPYRRAARSSTCPARSIQLAARRRPRRSATGTSRCSAVCATAGSCRGRASSRSNHQRSGAFPRMLLIAHEDVLVFTPDGRTPRTRRREGARCD